MLVVLLPAHAGLGAAASLEIPGPLQGIGQIDSSASIDLQDGDNLPTPDCKYSGGSQNGNSLCKTILAGGTTVSSESHFEKAWSDSKEQTVITVFDAESRITSQRVVRRKIAYDAADKTKKIKEFFDIVRYPPNQKITREFLTVQYHKDGKTAAKITYAEYTQIDGSAFASLIRHTVLNYDAHGKPLKGQADLWKDGQKTKELFRWNRLVQDTKEFDGEVWRQWETIVNKVAAQQAPV